MNEQLIVKNFGPFQKEGAEVTFKKVTLFIGPTGGGKSTLAKLSAIFRDKSVRFSQSNKAAYDMAISLFHKFEISDFFSNNALLSFKKEGQYHIDFTKKKATIIQKAELPPKRPLEELIEFNAPIIPKNEPKRSEWISQLADYYNANDSFGRFSTSNPLYIPADRAFAGAIQGALAGLQLNSIALPYTLLSFTTEFELAKQFVKELPLPFFEMTYSQRRGIDTIIAKNGKSIKLSESASGIQAVLPLLIVLEYQSNPMGRASRAARSFLIEEPELNLYPAAQQELLNWLVEKCTKGENDLTLTTHSPYILSHLNLLLYAYQVADKHPDRREAVAAIVPEASWINPKEFACYHVGDGGVKSLVDEELGLIDNNELDNISGDKADAFDQLISINRGF